MFDSRKILRKEKKYKGKWFFHILFPMKKIKENKM